MRARRTFIALWVALSVGPAILPRLADGQEPMDLSGTWVGTWWIGKYQEPAALEVVQTGTHISGTFRVWGHPSDDGAVAAAPGLEARVSGEVEGHRIRLTGLTPDHRRFHADFVLSAPRTLRGLGHAPGGMVGFELTRDR